ncbi:globin family protein [Brumimicrobium mesophilum]|uniref:hypothetical protein n=1 Tax=Brumimicrobium mesophilum TaxID=392717 RepID=UPI000D1434C4|nr:hypothetical protein [Brumimicrobium mesophilum]
MFKKSKTPFVIVLTILIGFGSFMSCKKDEVTPPEVEPPVLMSTPLYDTLGWFIQGGDPSMAIEGQGTKSISDPDNSGQMIQAGRLAIRKVVEGSLQIIAGDTVLAKYFPTLLNEVGNGNTTGFAQLLESFTDFTQQAVSGQMVYQGKSMADAHNNMTYSRFGSANQQFVTDNADFDKFVGDIVLAAQGLNVPNSVIGQLGVILYSTENDIVQ